MLKPLFFILLLVFISDATSFAQTKKAKRADNGERLITALATSQNMPGVVGDDGVFVNTAIEEVLPPEVKRILNLKQKAIPLLIAHLDDMRLTRMYYCCNGSPRMTVADACLNILARTIRPASPMFDVKCVKDRDELELEGTCLEEKYDFFPGSYVRRGKVLLPTDEVKTAKRNWLKAYRNKLVQFQGY